MEKTRLIGGFIAIIFLVTPLTADPLSKSKPIDFYRDVTSRHLQGTATRSDGHLLNGPDVKSLETDLGELISGQTCFGVSLPMATIC